MRLLSGDGERGRNRTFNLLIKSQLLCQLSYAPEPFAFIDSCEVDRAGLGGTFTKLSQQPVQLEPPHCIAHFIYADNVTTGRTPPASVAAADLHRDTFRNVRIHEVSGGRPADVVTDEPSYLYHGKRPRA